MVAISPPVFNKLEAMFWVKFSTTVVLQILTKFIGFEYYF